MATPAVESGATRTGRAAPLPPDERRRAILHDVRALVLDRGAAVTTRELALAAGVSEGTLFRVFDDKVTLLRETVHAAVDPVAVVPALDAIDRDLPLDERLTRILEIGFERIGETMRWFAVLHELGRLEPNPQDLLEQRRRTHREWAQHQQAGQLEVRLAVARVLEPDAAALARPVDQVVALLDVVLVGAAMQQGEAARRGTTANIPAIDVLVTHFLHGALAPSTTRSPS
ncbi:TetR/AcrR family transcriptional regulator [Cellulomonas sp. PhB150]|uniref:TetR/AcrR family transcriptional regulator n=1 Tax=Cellulomonas sp. PhB150 TaxID=2485188 RepID=UPI000F4A49B3|nr:TetR/AcrR family transcriptional regulator [Cellulomonas sp. PhB150]ROS30412.1 TetR family transcriptional regulator [Cellulomonas sp. PhB150]